MFHTILVPIELRSNDFDSRILEQILSACTVSERTRGEILVTHINTVGAKEEEAALFDELKEPIFRVCDHFKVPVKFLCSDIEVPLEEALVQLVERFKADLLVMGTHADAPSLSDKLLSSASSIIQTCPIPLLVVPRNMNLLLTVSSLLAERSLNQLERLVVPIDPSMQVDELFSLETGVVMSEVAQTLGAQIHFTSVIQVIPKHMNEEPVVATTYYEAELLEEREAAEKKMLELVSWMNQFDVRVSYEILRNTSGIVNTFVNYAASFENTMVMTSSHQRKGLAKFFFGSLSESFAHKGMQPTLVLPNQWIEAQTKERLLETA